MLASPFRYLLHVDQDESSLATSVRRSGVGTRAGGHVEDGDFTNVLLSSTPWQSGQRIGSWPVHSRTRSIQLLHEGCVGCASWPRSCRQRSSLVATLTLASRP